MNASIIIPACNEAEVIERCLASLFVDSSDMKLEILVICNGCNDDTAARARAFSPQVRVKELPRASKAAALAYGDRIATLFPRFCIDADVELSKSALRDVASVLTDGSPFVVAAPQVKYSLIDRTWGVRAFYRTWASLPFFQKGFVGAGVYAISRRGRERFVEFPEIIADDGYIRLIANPDERLTLTTCNFTAWPPRSLRNVCQVMARVRAGGKELIRRFPELAVNETTSPRSSLRAILVNPKGWPGAIIYLLVMAYAEFRASSLEASGARVPWAQDQSSRHNSRNSPDR